MSASRLVPCSIWLPVRSITGNTNANVKYTVTTSSINTSIGELDHVATGSTATLNIIRRGRLTRRRPLATNGTAVTITDGGTLQLGTRSGLPLRAMAPSITITSSVGVSSTNFRC